MADENNPAVQELVIDVYKARILDPSANTQEILAYLDQMTLARKKQLSSASASDVKETTL